MKKLIKKNNGFSLIELLIVIAIIGIISIIAFSMFTGVVQNSRKKADDRHALVIEKAVLAYMLESEDFGLEHLAYSSSPITVNMKDTLTPSVDLIYALQHTINCTKDGKSIEIFPILNPTSGTTPSTSSYAPQWNNYAGYKIEVFESDVKCNVTPVTHLDEAYVFVIE